MPRPLTLAAVLAALTLLGACSSALKGVPIEQVSFTAQGDAREMQRLSWFGR